MVLLSWCIPEGVLLWLVLWGSTAAGVASDLLLLAGRVVVDFDILEPFNSFP